MLKLFVKQFSTNLEKWFKMWSCVKHKLLISLCNRPTFLLSRLRQMHYNKPPSSKNAPLFEIKLLLKWQQIEWVHFVWQVSRVNVVGLGGQTYQKFMPAKLIFSGYFWKVSKFHNLMVINIRKRKYVNWLSGFKE